MDKELACGFVEEILTRRVYGNSGRFYSNEKQIETVLDNFLEITTKEPPVLSLSGKFCVVGDIHGDIDSLLRIFEKNGYPPSTSFIFLGDYVDRGQYSCEVLLLLYSLKILFPKKIYLLRGNHEFSQMTASYGFMQECYRKLSGHLYNKICETFDTLPIAAVVGKTLCVHGGLSPRVKTLHDLFSLSKPRQYAATFDGFEAEIDLLWSDPDSDIEDFEENMRGLGYVFGVKPTLEFLENCNLTRVIRAHQSCHDGYDWAFGEDGQILTVFSTCDYAGMLNDGASVVIDSETTDITITAFPVLSRKQIIQRRVTYPEWILTNVSFRNSTFGLNIAEQPFPLNITPLPMVVA